MLNLFLSKLESSTNRKAVKNLAELVFSCVHSIMKFIPSEQCCPVCSAALVVLMRPVMSDTLAREWNVNSEWVNYFNRREGEICLSCGGSIRGRMFALALLKWIGVSQGIVACGMKSLVRHPRVMELKIAEINSCGPLHKHLKKLKNLAYSEYSPDDGATRHEDLLALSYPDEKFDIILHSDTLEHIPDVDRALFELRRVLKPGGAMIFSIPVVRDGRSTLVRASLQNGILTEHLTPSYHGGSYQKTQQYLVCSEFGEDFFETVRKSGFQLDILEHPTNPAAFTIIAVKAGG